MKKNKALTAALSVFALTMMSMCAIGGTFAKYVTSDNDTDSARVAKWGVTVDVAGYATKTVCEVNTETADAEIIAAGAEVEESIIAPGSQAKILTIDIGGRPEVDVKINHTPVVTLTGDWVDKDGNFYCPIVFSVKEGNNAAVEVEMTGEINDKAKLEDALENAIVALNENSLDADSDLNTAYDVTISWKWAYTGDDVKDTYLGDVAAGIVDGKTAPGFSIKITTTVSQND